MDIIKTNFKSKNYMGFEKVFYQGKFSWFFWKPFPRGKIPRFLNSFPNKNSIGLEKPFFKGKICGRKSKVVDTIGTSCIDQYVPYRYQNINISYRFKYWPYWPISVNTSWYKFYLFIYYFYKFCNFWIFVKVER